jgi:hypothetical protein
LSCNAFLFPKILLLIALFPATAAVEFTFLSPTQVTVFSKLNIILFLFLEEHYRPKPIVPPFTLKSFGALHVFLLLLTTISLSVQLFSINVSIFQEVDELKYYFPLLLFEYLPNQCHSL